MKAIDFVGVLLALGGTSVFLLGLTWDGGKYPWDSVHVIVTLVIGFAVSVSFVAWQWKGARVPLIPLHIFAGRIVNGASLAMFINGWNNLVQIYYIPTFYQLVFEYSTVKAAAMLLPITLLQSELTHSHGRLILTCLSCEQHWLRSDRALDRSLSRVHPNRLGVLGCRSRSVLNIRRDFRNWQANRLRHLDWPRCR